MLSKSDLFLEILLIAHNTLIINTNWNSKMTKETDKGRNFHASQYVPF